MRMMENDSESTLKSQKNYTPSRTKPNQQQKYMEKKGRTKPWISAYHICRIKLSA